MESPSPTCVQMWVVNEGKSQEKPLRKEIIMNIGSQPSGDSLEVLERKGSGVKIRYAPKAQSVPLVVPHCKEVSWAKCLPLRAGRGRSSTGKCGWKKDTKITVRSKYLCIHANQPGQGRCPPQAIQGSPTGHRTRRPGDTSGSRV